MNKLKPAGMSSQRDRNDAPLSSARRRKLLPQAADRLLVGQAGLAVSPICIGSVTDPETVSIAFDLGINFFFLTADMHWPDYEGTRRGLADLLRRRRGVRDRIVVAVASYVTQPEFTYLPFIEVIKSVPRLERLDMIVVGGAHRSEFAIRREIYVRRVERQEFGARVVGATFHDREAAVAAINAEQIDLAFIRYNPMHPGARTDVFPRLRASSTRIFNFNSMRGYVGPHGLRKLGVPKSYWRPVPTDYYRFAFSQPAIEGILCSPRRPHEVRALDRALKLPALDEREERYLIDVADLSAGRVRLASTRQQEREDK